MAINGRMQKKMEGKKRVIMIMMMMLMEEELRGDESRECISSGDSAAGSLSCLAERVMPRGVVIFR